MDDADLAEAAELLRRLLDEIEAGHLDATSSTATALRRRLEGAAIALATMADLTGGAQAPEIHGQ